MYKTSFGKSGHICTLKIFVKPKADWLHCPCSHKSLMEASSDSDVETNALN